jgi:hypothetical protein
MLCRPTESAARVAWLDLQHLVVDYHLSDLCLQSRPWGLLSVATTSPPGKPVEAHPQPHIATGRVGMVGDQWICDGEEVLEGVGAEMGARIRRPDDAAATIKVTFVSEEFNPPSSVNSL